MKILIVGGTGNISWRLTQAALSAGWDVTILNRGGGERVRRPVPQGCHIIHADMNNSSSVKEGLGRSSFDVIIDFICYNAAQAERAITYFNAHTQHYIFISTTALYDRQIAKVPYLETSPLITQGWDYAMAKLGAEKIFAEERRRSGFPVTVIRPGHTYDTIIPEAVGDADWTNPWRLLNNKPVVIHGDGTTLWTVTHSCDFASGVVEFLKAGHAPGETFHITSDVTYNWRQITATLCHVLGVQDPKICYRTVDEIDYVAPRYGNGLKGHKMWCDVYDNTKFKKLCPSWNAIISLEAGLKEAILYYQSHPQLMVPNMKLDSLLDTLCVMR